MSVNKPDRKESRVEFENAYFHVYDDALRLMKNNYGASKELVTEYENYIRIMNAKIFSIINDLGTYIRIANSILSHGFTFMQIKYNFDHNKIIKRPSHSKIVRERKRLKKYKILYDKRIVSGYHIQNCYKSWRNNILKDCNRVSRTINNMDKLYNQLFPIHEVYHKTTRKEIIKIIKFYMIK